MKRVDRIEAKVDKIDERLDSIDKTLAAQHVSLKEHIRRTELLEADVAPIKTHVSKIEGALKLIGVVSLGIGIAVGLIEIVKFIKGM
jgi:septal ring factor EnvC (AmiA/AmiB activator)